MKQFIFAIAAVAACGSAMAAPLKSASVTKVVNDVRISKNSAAAQSATMGQRMTGKSTLLTGRGSRAELTFPDRTVTRIGANSVFRFSSASREMEIERGSFLLNVPKNAGGAKIRTATVTAAITGTTTMMEYSPGQWLKFIVLEGVAKLSNDNGDTINVPPGQMIIMHPNAKNFPRPVVLNIDKLVKTSGLMKRGGFAPLNGAAVDLIAHSVGNQLERRRGGELLPSGIVVRGPGGRIGGNGGDPHGNPRTGVPIGRSVNDSGGGNGGGGGGGGGATPPSPPPVFPPGNP